MFATLLFWGEPLSAQKAPAKPATEESRQKPQVELPPAQKAPLINKSNQMKSRQRGRTLVRPLRKEMMKEQNAILRNAQPVVDEPDYVKRSKAAAASAGMAGDQQGNTMPRKQRKQMMKEQNQLQRGAQPVTEEPDYVKRGRAGSKSAEISGDQQGNTMPRPARKQMMKDQSKLQRDAQPVTEEPDYVKRARAGSKSAQMAGDETGNTMTRPNHKKMMRLQNEVQRDAKTVLVESSETKEARAKKKSATIKDYQQQLVEHPDLRQLDMMDASRRISNFEAGNTMERREYRDMLRERNRKIAEYERGNVMSRTDYKEMLAKKSKAIREAERGNTMVRKDYKRMVAKRMKGMREAEKGNTMERTAYGRMLKNKSEDLANYEAGYLNTKAEKRARLRSLFFPKEYQPNTPEEKRERARDRSKLAANFEGKAKRRPVKIKNAHNSATGRNTKTTITDIDDRDNARRKGARKIAHNSKGFIPTFLKRKEKKAVYDEKTEGGIWND